MSILDGIIAYHCHVCDIWFDTESELRTHSVIHKKEHKCDICRRNIAESQLKYHIKWHKLERQLQGNEDISLNRALDLNLTSKVQQGTLECDTECSVDDSLLPSPNTEQLQSKEQQNVHLCCAEEFQKKGESEEYIVKGNHEKVNECELFGKHIGESQIKYHIKWHQLEQKLQENGRLNSTFDHNLTSKDCQSTSECDTECSVDDSLLSNPDTEQLQSKEQQKVNLYCPEEFRKKVESEEHIVNANHFVTHKKVHECELCGRDIKESQIKYHIKWHQLQQKLQESGCLNGALDHSLASKGELEEHVAKENPSVMHKKLHKCDSCGRVVSKSQIENHIKWHELGRQLQGNEGEGLNTALDHASVSSLRVHLLSRCCAKKQKCDICYRLIEESELENHMKWHYSEKHCENLEKESSKEFAQSEKQPGQKRKLAVRRVTKPLKTIAYPTECDTAEQSSDTSRFSVELTNDTEHLEEENIDDSSIITNTDSLQHLADVSKLTSHVQNMEHVRIREVYSYNCRFCLEIFKEKSELIRHMARDKHETIKLFQCHVCKDHFGKASTLRRHFKSHQKIRIKRQKCDICWKEFKEAEITNHMRWHELKGKTEGTKCEEQKSNCEICGKNFVQTEKLAYHMKWHQLQRQFDKLSSEKAYKKFNCDICGKCFRECEKLEYHMKWHRLIDALDPTKNSQNETLRIEDEKILSNQECEDELPSTNGNANSNEHDLAKQDPKDIIAEIMLTCGMTTVENDYEN